MKIVMKYFYVHYFGRKNEVLKKMNKKTNGQKKFSEEQIFFKSFKIIE